MMNLKQKLEFTEIIFHLSENLRALAIHPNTEPKTVAAMLRQQADLIEAGISSPSPTPTLAAPREKAGA
jgi:hypothetical protein